MTRRSIQTAWSGSRSHSRTQNSGDLLPSHDLLASMEETTSADAGELVVSLVQRRESNHLQHSERI